MHFFGLFDGQLFSILELLDGLLAKEFEILDLGGGFLGSGQGVDEVALLPEDILLHLVGVPVCGKLVAYFDCSSILEPFGWILLGELGQKVPVGTGFDPGLDGMRRRLGYSLGLSTRLRLILIWRCWHESK